MILKSPQPASWVDYFDAVKDFAPRDTTVKAAGYFIEHNIRPDTVVDLGCGDGRETMYMLNKGWRVHAIDKSEEGLSRLRARLTPEQARRVTIQAASFETLALPQNADWINASYSLPFCRPVHFEKFWNHVVDSIKSGGLLSGQLFGDRDTWNADANITTLTLEKAQSLLAPFELLYLEESEKDGTTASGTPKHWHIFNFVARKKISPKSNCDSRSLLM